MPLWKLLTGSDFSLTSSASLTLLLFPKKKKIWRQIYTASYEKAHSHAINKILNCFMKVGNTKIHNFRSSQEQKVKYSWISRTQEWFWPWDKVYVTGPSAQCSAINNTAVHKHTVTGIRKSQQWLYTALHFQEWRWQQQRLCDPPFSQATSR